MHFIPAYAIGWESETVSQCVSPCAAPVISHSKLPLQNLYAATSSKQWLRLPHYAGGDVTVSRDSETLTQNSPCCSQKESSGCRWGRRTGWTSSNTSKKFSAVLLEISYVAICSLPPVKKPGFIFLKKVTLVGPFTWTPRLVSVL